jgi:hypothetical protein
MWSQKKSHGNESGNGNGNFSLKKSIPKLKGTGDIDSLLAKSNTDDLLEEEQVRRDKRERERERDESFCGC